MWRCAFNRILVEGHKDGRFTRSTKVGGLDDDSSGKYGHDTSNVEMELCESWYFAIGFQLERPLYIPVCQCLRQLPPYGENSPPVKLDSSGVVFLPISSNSNREHLTD